MLSDREINSAYGFWLVSTEGDVEGRTTRHLGVHEGYLDDVAFALAAQSYYALHFKRVDPRSLPKTPTALKVTVSLEGKTWSMTPDQRVTAFKELLDGRNVRIESGSSYASVNLIRGIDKAAEERARHELLVQSAKDKLSKDELNALGIRE